MSEVNFNMIGLDKVNNVVYCCNCGACGDKNYGYRAIINGHDFGISDIRTVSGLKQIAPEISIHHNDVNKFISAVTGQDTSKIEVTKVTK